MLHDIDEPIPAVETALKLAYQQIVDISGDEIVSKAVAFADAADEVSKLIDLGEVQEPSRLKSLLGSLNVIDSKEGASADRIINSTRRGEVSLFEDDSTLSTVVTLGGGGRKTWRNVNADDLRSMNEVRNKNYKAQTEAMEAWREDYSHVLPVVLAHRTVGAAVLAGAFAG